MTEYTTVSLESIGHCSSHGNNKYAALWEKLKSTEAGNAVVVSGDRKVQLNLHNAIYNRVRGSNQRVRVKRIDESSFAIWLEAR